MKRLIVYVIVVCVVVGAFMAVNVFFTTSSTQLENKGSEIERTRPLTKITTHDYTLKVTPNEKVTYTNIDVAHFAGHVNSEVAQITVNEQQVSIDEKGQFDVIFSMQPGENKFIFVYEDSQRGNREEKVFRWIMDVAAPDFQITKPLQGIEIPLSAPDVDIAGEFILFDEKSHIEDGVTVEVNATPLAISDSRRGFTGIIKLEDGKHKLNIVATDKAGNKAMKTVFVEVDTTAPVINIEDYKVVREKMSPPLIRFSGTVTESAYLSFEGRPINVDEQGKFQFEIYLANLDAMQKEGKVMFQAKDNAGNLGTAALPKGGDFIPPRWLKLELVAYTDTGAALAGKVSEANVEVRIGAVEAVSDAEGVLRIEGVVFNQDKPVIKTVLRDKAGNESHIEQWVSIHPKGK